MSALLTRPRGAGLISSFDNESSYWNLYNNESNARSDWSIGRTLEEFVNHSPTARHLRILLVFYQRRAWFMSL